MSRRRTNPRLLFLSIATLGFAALLSLAVVLPNGQSAAVEPSSLRERNSVVPRVMDNPSTVTGPSTASKSFDSTESTGSDRHKVINWRGGQRDHRWSNPGNWVGGHVPGEFDVARFNAHSKSDTEVDVDSSGIIAGLELEPGYRAKITLKRDLTITGDLRIAGGSFEQRNNTLNVRHYSQSGGMFSGGSAKLTINDEATVSAGTLTTPKSMKAESLIIDSPGVVRMSANGKLELSGSGEPLKGSGILDVATNQPNSVEYTGQSRADLTSAGPVRGLHNIRKPAPDDLPSDVEGPQDQTKKKPVTPDNFNRVGALTLTRGDSYLECGVIDPAGGFAYFCTGTSPAAVVKVRLSDFTRVGALTLNPGEDALGSAAIDPAGGFAYFGTNTTPGRVVKVRLSDFTRVGGVTLNSGENSLRAAVIDPAGGFAYFGTNTSPGNAVKVRLSDLTRVDGLTLSSGENFVRSAVIDPAAGFAYFGTSTSPGRVVKLRLSDFTRVGALPMNAGENSLRSAVIDTVGGFAYFGANSTVVKVRLSDFTRVGALSGLGLGENSFRSATIDTAGGFAYFANYQGFGTPSLVIKVRLSDFTKVSTLSFNADESFIFAAIIDPAGGFAYFGTDNSPGRVVKVRLSDFTRVGVLTFVPGEDALLSGVIDSAAGFAYFGAYTEPGIIIKVRLSDFTRVGALTLNPGENDLFSGVIDPAGGFAYFGTDTLPGTVVKVRLSDFTRVGSLTLNPGEDELVAAMIDPAAGFAYFCAWITQTVVKIRLSDFTRVGALALMPSDGFITGGAVIDPAGGFAYVGATSLNSTGGRVVKIRLSDFTRVGALALPPGEDFLFTGVIDATAGFAYFANQNGNLGQNIPSIVTKIRLSDFTRVSSLMFNPGEDNLWSSVIDPAAGFAYFTTFTNPGRIVKVRLSDLTRADALTFNSQEKFTSAVIDPAQSFAYFGADNAPGIVTKVDLSNVPAATTSSVSSSANPSAFGQSVTFTATLTSTRGTPTGTVQFKDNSVNLGAPAALNASGAAQLTTSSLSVGTHTITADYSGDPNFVVSSGTLTGGQVVKGGFSLSQSNYSVSETAGSITISVSRNSDTTQAATVDYRTNDTGAPTACGDVNGLASSRCDFTTATGTLSFAVGEIQKTFTVLVNGDSYVEGPETFTVNLSNPTGGAVLLAPSSATVTITDGPTGPPANLIDDPRFFARQHYHDFLNREPDPPGWDFWTNQITSCGTNPACIDDKRNNVSASFFVSIEFQQTGYLVERMYKAAYGDATGNSIIGGAHTLPVPIVRFNEFLPDTQRIGQGVVVGQTGWEIVLENNKQAFASEFVQRSRFTTAFATTLTPAQFVDMLFANAGVTPSSTDRNAAIAEFGSATNTSDVAARGRALRRVAENTTLVTNEFNRAFVLMQYFGYLRRNPNDPPEASLDHSGYEFWLNKLNFFNGDYIKAEMVKAFITSFEYRNRFGL